jgi:proteic killer suppression protein
VDITFKNKKLKKYAEDFNACSRQMGSRSAELFFKRLNALKVVDSLDDVKAFPGRFHELTGDRKGQWSCDLDHPYRLIFEPLVVQEKVNIQIVEIADYH